MTIEIELTNTWARVRSMNSDEDEWLVAQLSCEDTRFQAKKSPAFMEDDSTTYCMYDRLGRIFPAGLLHNLRGAAKAAGYDIAVDDQREAVCAIDLDRSRVAWLRDYQWEAVCKAARRGRGLIDAPTGAGKTEVFIALTRVLACEWLFVVHRADLVGQTAARYLKRTGEQVGTFEKGVWKQGTCNVTVATFQSIYRAMSSKVSRAVTKLAAEMGRPNRTRIWDAEALLRNTEAVFVDEVHAQPAESYYNVSMALTRAYYRFGASATCLDRSERENLRTIAATGPFAYRISHQMLVARGILAKSVVRMIECRQGDWEPAARWPVIENDLIVCSRERNELVAEMVKRAKKPCLCFVNYRKQGHTLEQLIKTASIKVEFVHGKHLKPKRMAMIRELERSNIDVILCTVIFQEGIDIPSLRSVVCAPGGKSTVAAIQRRGRATRIAAGEGGDVFELWDVLDLGHYWLEEHAHLRLEAYESRGDSVQVGWD